MNDTTKQMIPADAVPVVVRKEGGSEVAAFVPRDRETLAEAFAEATVAASRYRRLVRAAYEREDTADARRAREAAVVYADVACLALRASNGDEGAEADLVKLLRGGRS
jgi:hypothetical protein